MYDTSELQTRLNEQIQDSTAWYTDGEMILTISLLVGLAVAITCGVITTLVARHNERDMLIAFFAGFFLGGIGIATYAIMGETIELRVYLEEKERNKLANKQTLSSKRVAVKE